MKAFPEIIAIVDTETTGMRPGFARVMDIGIIRVEKGKITEKYQTFVNPGQSVPGFISSFTGISDEDLVGAPQFDEVALEVERLLKDAVFVAHNAAFDYGFIKAEFARVGIDWKAETLCSVKLSRALFPRERSHSLDSLIEREKIVCSARHRALPDAEVVWEFFQRVSKKVPAKILRSSIQAVMDGSVRNVGRDTFGKLPDSAGVYFFYGPEQELLYIGKSKHVKTRAKSHFNPSAVAGASKFSDEITSIESIATPGELSALLLESALIKTQSPLHNRMLRRKKILVIARRVRDADGYDRIELEKSGDISPKDDVMSVFRTQVQGKNVLHSLAKEFRLCEKMLGIDASRGECFARQLGNCDGACVHALAASDHNLRIQEAFRKRRIISWPFTGPIMVKEVANEESGCVFFIDEWVLVGAFRYEDGNYQTLIDGAERFEYDTYKILARYLRRRANRRTVQEMSRREFNALLSECRGEREEAVA
jgi:DNA polymerase III subunit epsilon